MNSKRFAARRAPLGIIVSLAVLAAGCTATSPAPVVSRTPPGPALPPVQTLPLPLPQTPPAVVTAPERPVGSAAGSATTPESTDSGVQTSPIRSGSVESGTVAGAALPGSGFSADPNLRTGPRGVKRPYSDTAVRAQPAIERPGAGVVTIPAQTPPIQTAAVASSSQVQPPSSMPAPGAAVPAAAVPSAVGSGLLDGVTFAWPSAGTVSQSFEQTSSKGLSFNGRAGDAVLAAADGRVIFSGAGPRGYGNLIIVKHAGELLSVYAHNRSLAVKEGDSVKRGQKIAELGNSGTDKPKLHFEIRQGGKPIDPLAVLPRR